MTEIQVARSQGANFLYVIARNPMSANTTRTWPFIHAGNEYWWTVQNTVGISIMPIK